MRGSNPEFGSGLFRFPSFPFLAIGFLISLSCFLSLPSATSFSASENIIMRPCVTRSYVPAVAVAVLIPVDRKGPSRGSSATLLPDVYCQDELRSCNTRNITAGEYQQQSHMRCSYVEAYITEQSTNRCNQFAGQLATTKVQFNIGQCSSQVQARKQQHVNWIG